MNVQLGAMHAASFATDPKHLGFVLARYKFVARMLHGCGNVLEVGAGDGTGAKVVAPVVGHLTLIDREPLSDAVNKWDILQQAWQSPPSFPHDAVYALDVLEHIPPYHENLFFANVTETLASQGVVIIGMPSKESQPYASELSRLHHVNCKTEAELRETMLRHFHNVFMFGMNDETLHTGFGPLCHYRLAIGVGKR